MSTFQFECVELKLQPCTEQFGRFIGKSLEKGYGMTIGTVLRRVLLTNLWSLSIVGVRISDINHEFGTIEGVREDVLEILLNLKEIIFKEDKERFDELSLLIGKPIGRLRIQGPAIITASSLNLPPNICIVNPSHYIATISDNSILELEVHLDWGKGYRLAENQKSVGRLDDLDYLKVDSIFMPVSRVNTKIESITPQPMSNDSEKESEQLILDIWTNGSLTPDEALFQATQVIIDWFETIQNLKFSEGVDELDFAFNENDFDFFDDDDEDFFAISESKNEVGFPSKKDAIEVIARNETSTPFANIKEKKEKDTVQIPLEQLHLSARAYNALKRAEINFVDQLTKYSVNELKQIKNFGQKSLSEVLEALEKQYQIYLK